MSAHQPIHAAPELDAPERLAARMAELDARFAPEREASQRAMEQVERELPQLTWGGTSILADPVGFMASGSREGERRDLYRRLMDQWEREQ